MTTTTIDSATGQHDTELAHQPRIARGRAAEPRTTFSKPAIWTGRIMTGVVSALLCMDAAIKVVELQPAIEGTRELGYPVSVVMPLGLVLLACLALYLIPRTAVLGAVLLTGYLGGAVATHVRVGNPWASHVLTPIYVAVFVWGGLYLRDARVRALLRGPSGR